MKAKLSRGDDISVSVPAVEDTMESGTDLCILEFFKKRNPPLNIKAHTLVGNFSFIIN